MGYLASALTTQLINQSEFDSIAKIVRNRILSICEPERIYIFGSFARGRISKLSDLDIAIFFKTPLELKSKKKLILNSRLFLDYSTDILFYTTEEFEKRASVGGVCSIIQTEGKIIYDKRTTL
jgi:uncharacterized protein